MPNVYDANVEVHTRMADSYNSKEPHFRPENQDKVRARLLDVRNRVSGGKLLDIGCGTGFIIHLAAPIFDEIHGVDITPAMMAKVRLDAGNITLHQAFAENLPFEDNSFDAVSAYSFIDHVQSPPKVLAEVSRVLKPGGVLYIDLAPNRLFWEAVSGVEASNDEKFSAIVSREISMVKENDKKVEQEYGIRAETFRLAEPGKESGGIDPHEIKSAALDNGFSACDVRFDWFLGQGSIMHGQSFSDARIIDEYLQLAAPLSNHMYKYLTLYAVK